MSVSIAPLAPADVGALSALAREIWHAHYPPIIGIAQTDYMLAQRYAPEVIREELARNDVWWDVLRDESAMIGFASSFAAGEPRTIKLDKLYVHQARQRQGYGRMLLSHTCARARKLGFDRVVLAVNKRNEQAIAAYRKYGFEVVDAVVKDIGGGFVMDDYVMRLSVL